LIPAAEEIPEFNCLERWFPLVPKSNRLIIFKELGEFVSPHTLLLTASVYKSL
jgi:hypothetical protein